MILLLRHATLATKHTCSEVSLQYNLNPKSVCQFRSPDHSADSPWYPALAAMLPDKRPFH